MLLALTSRVNLEERYGAGGFDRIREAVAAYAIAVAPTEAILYAPDDDASAAGFNLAPAPAGTADELVAAVRRGRAPQGLTGLLLIGGPDIVPHATTDNLKSPDGDDGDAQILTDNHYGCKTDDAGTFMIPDLPLGRLVGEADAGVDSLVAHTDRMAEYHRS